MPSVIPAANSPGYRDDGAASQTQPQAYEFVPSSYPSRSEQLLNKLCGGPVTISDAITQAQVPLDIIIIGAGLGGLAASIALARRGHTITVLEKAHALGEAERWANSRNCVAIFSGTVGSLNVGQIGAGVQVPPNSTRLLRAWGIGPLLAAKASQPAAFVTRRWQDGAVIGYAQLIPNAEDSFEAPHYVIHRADYHAVLHKFAAQLGVVVRVNSKVVGYVEETATVELSTGETLSADLLVAADGIHSLGRSAVLGGIDSPPEWAGFAAYRATLDTASMMEDPDTAWLLESPSMNLWIGENRHAMVYGISKGQTFNLVLSHEDHSDPSTWSNVDVIASMRDHFAGWDPKLNKLIHMVKSAVKWPLMNGSRLPTWVSKNSKLVILGDAAHAMFPYMAQGAAMAVEDGAALAEALSLVTSKKDTSSALHLFEKVRMKRSYGMQSASMVNGRLLHLPDGPEQQARDRGMEAEVKGRPFVESTNQMSDPMTQIWAYGYDAEKAIRDAWVKEKTGAKA